MNVTVIGAGRMGLPLAIQLATNGARVHVCDVQARVVEQINCGISPIEEPGVPARVGELVRQGQLHATLDTPAAVAASDIVIVIVPVILTVGREADTTTIERVSYQIAEGLKPGTLVSYETTLPVGGTRRLVPLLACHGLTAGEDFDVVYSPERVKSQYVLQHLAQTPKIIGGLTPRATERAAAFYRTYLGAPVMTVGTLETAELVKLAGMLYRDVNIALANELARYAVAVEVDLPTVIAAANTDGEAALLAPGVGVGGHCTPVYPYFLIHDAHRRGVALRLAEQSRRINESQPAHLVERLERTWRPLRGQRVLILGLGFRPQVKEHLFSPAYALRDELCRRGAEVQLHDPLYSDEEIRLHGFTPGALTTTSCPPVLILNTAHAAYADLDFPQLVARGLKAVADGRALWEPDRVRRSGLIYIGIGRPECRNGEAVSRPIPIAQPSLTGDEAEAVAEVIRSGWIAQGPQVAAFEQEFAACVGAPYACAVSSGTAALHVALVALGVQPGDEVITVSHSFIATANSIRYCGATPVFVDIEPTTFNMDPSLLERAITPRTRAILCVHQMGMPCDLRTILDVACRHRLRVIEDAACALGSEIMWEGQWERLGKPHADITCFSFHPRKVITTGEGGMLTTAQRTWDQRFRMLRHQGLTADDAYGLIGFNYRMTDIHAAIGREQLKRLTGMMTRRRALAERYRTRLADISGLGLPAEPSWARSNWQSYCVRLPERCDQQQVMQALRQRGVATRRGIMCIHREAAYADAMQRRSLPISETAQDQCLILPLYDHMTHDEQDHVIAALRTACQEVFHIA